jgi:flagella basal body P-ring formation protein FlgA
LLKHAKALRDLTQGSVLSRRDFGIRHQVLMTTGSISRGQKINSANAETSNYFGHLPSDVALKLADVAHMEATRSLKADQLIRLSDLRPSAMFNKGDSVELTISRGILTITVDMLALEQGRMDQQVNLLNPESNETVRAIVTGPSKAKGL